MTKTCDGAETVGKRGAVSKTVEGKVEIRELNELAKVRRHLDETVVAKVEAKDV